MEAYDPEREVIYKFCLYSLEAEALQEVERNFKDKYQFVSSMPERGRMHSIEVISVKIIRRAAFGKCWNIMAAAWMMRLPSATA